MRAVAQAGGRALVVGGWVRDRLLGHDQKDLDLEVYGLAPALLEAALQPFGTVIQVGRAFAVMRIKGIDVDIALPQHGARGEIDPSLDYAEASRRRDLCVNSMAWDPLSGELIDPHGGRDDLERQRLRAIDPRTFPEDPLRALRVARLAAQLEMRPDAELCGLCAALDLGGIPGERIFGEFRRLLLFAERPSVGFEFLRETSLLRDFPELALLPNLSQDVRWHPEGSVWVHTMLVLDEAAKLRRGRASDDLALMWGALCHDLGKACTTRSDGERIVSPGHSAAGVPLSEGFLSRLRAPTALIRAVGGLVRHHLAPRTFVREGAKARAYRRLARDLESRGVSLELLNRLARADHLGRTAPGAKARRFPAGDVFLERARKFGVERMAPAPVVLGRHLLARGFEPGLEIGRLLARCREVQDETGWSDETRILDRVLLESR